MSDDASDLLAGLIEEFTQRLRAGERPAIEDYALAYPALAERIRRVFRGLMELEACQPRHVAAEPTDEGRRIIGGYLIVRELGRGGMGVVYEAIQERLARRVALKVLARGGAANAAAVARFRREAAAAAALHHGNVVPVFEAGQDGDTVYYAMQLIGGCTLAHLVQAQQPTRLAAGDARTLTPEEAGAREKAASPAFVVGLGTASPRLDYRARAGLILQAARGLAYAHSRGMVHRDVKPSNLLLDNDGVVWVSDFGLVKIEDSALTETGHLVGTLRYLAPEQFQGQCDKRSDVYSLGLTLYELVTLQPAFGGSQHEILEAIRSRKPAAPRSIDPSIPRDLEKIILEATAKDPAARYPSADDFAEDLRRFVAGEPVHARPPGPLERLLMWARRDPVVASLAAAVAASLLLGLCFTLAFALRADQEARRAKVNADAALRHAGEAEASADLAGRREKEARDSEQRTKNALAQVSRERDARARALRRAEGLRLLAQSESVRGHDPTLALLLAVEGGRRAPGAVANAAMQEAVEDCHELRTLLGHTGPVFSAAFGADGRKAVTCGEDDVARLWDLATGKQLLSVKARDLCQACLSPDGSRLVTLSGPVIFRRRMPGGSGSRPEYWGQFGPVVRVFDASAGKLVGEWRPPAPRGAFAAYPAAGVSFGADGRHVLTYFAIDAPGLAVVLDLETGKLLETLDGPTPVFAAAFAPMGSVIATADGDGGVRLRDKGKVLHTLRGHKGDVAAVAFSADGTRLLTFGTGKKFASRDDLPLLTNAVDDAIARVWDVNGGKQLAALEWPDGDRVAPLAGRFHVNARHVTLVDPTRGRRVWDGATGKPWAVMQPNFLDFQTNPMQAAVAVGPDGQTAAYCGWDGTMRVLVGPEVVTLRGHQERADAVAFSPDGGLLLSASRDGTARLWAAPRVGVGNPTHENLWVTPWPLLTPDGSRLFVRHFNEPGAQVIDTATGLRTTRLEPFLWDALMSGDGRTVVALGSAGAFGQQPRDLIALDLATGQTATTPMKEGRLAALSGDGKLALLDLRDPTRFESKQDAVVIWDVAGGKRLARLKAPAEGIPQASFSPDGKRMLLGWAKPLSYLEPGLRVIDVGTGKELWRTGEPGELLAWAAFADGGREAVVVYGNGRWIFRAFDSATGEMRRTFSEEKLRPPEIQGLSFNLDRLRMLALSPDARRVLISPYSRAVGVWELAKAGAPALNLRGHEGEVTCCTYSRDGKCILTGGDDRTARVWDAGGGALKATMKGHDGAVIAMALDASGDRLVTATRDNVVRVWDVKTQQETARLRWRQQGIEGVAFSADGRRVCVRGRLVTRLWDLDVLAVAQRRLPRLLSPAERARFEVPQD